MNEYPETKEHTVMVIFSVSRISHWPVAMLRIQQVYRSYLLFGQKSQHDASW